MHELNFQGDYRFAEMKSGIPKPEYCPDCQSIGKSSRLEFSFISTLNGIWMCSDFKCNFPLNSEDLQAFIVAMGSGHNRRSKLHKNRHRRKRQSGNCYGDCARNNDISQQYLHNDSSKVISKPSEEKGNKSASNTSSQCVIPDNELNILPTVERNEMETNQTILIGDKNEFGKVSDMRASSRKNSSNLLKENTSLQISKQPSSASKNRLGDIEIDTEKLKSLTNYAPFVSKRRHHGLSKDDEDATGFVILESKILTVGCDDKDDKKESITEESFDSAYSSPTTDELNLQNGLSVGQHDNPSFEAAFQMIDSIFDDSLQESKQESFLSTDFFLDDTLDIFDNAVDLSKLC